MNWNRRTATWAGLALLVLTNAVALGGAAWNRSGEPDSRLQLSERELSVPWSAWSPPGAENSGLSLRLNWRCNPAAKTSASRASYYDDASPGWLDTRKLTELGFDMGRAGGTPGLHRPHEVREVWVVLELDGPAYRAWQAAAAAEAASAAAAEAAKPPPHRVAHVEPPHGASRLFAVDAGLDRAALRVRYADRAQYAVVRAKVGRLRDTEDVVDGGRIESLSIDEVNVPLALRPAFAAAAPAGRGGVERSRFIATVAFGRRAEPWLVDARPLPAAPDAR
ncbi:MAG: DUF4824 family protein [Burkholderiales bacterium]|nr:DUF4824 family protein [Burkholderiales bacterium]